MITAYINSENSELGNKILTLIIRRIDEELNADNEFWETANWFDVVNSYLKEYDAVGVIVNNRMTKIEFNNDALFTFCLLEAER